MAEMEQRLADWAHWRRTGSDGAGTARETEQAIALLPAALKDTVVQHYLGERAGLAWRARTAGQPEATVSRRLGRIHLLLTESLRSSREEHARARERAEMSQRLAGPPAQKLPQLR